MRTRVSFLSVSRSSSRASDGGGDLVFEIGGGGDAGAVGAVAAEAGEGLAVGPEIAGLALALDGHGEHEGEGVFARAGGAGEDEGVGQVAAGDGSTERLDGGGVADEVVEVGGERGCGGHGLHWMIRVRDGGRAGERCDGVRGRGTWRDLDGAEIDALSGMGLFPQLVEVVMIIGRADRKANGRHLLQFVPSRFGY